MATHRNFFSALPSTRRNLFSAPHKSFAEEKEVFLSDQSAFGGWLLPVGWMCEQTPAEQCASDEAVPYNGRQPDESEGGRFGHSGPRDPLLKLDDRTGRCRRR